MESPAYRSFLVRLWCEPDGPDVQWHGEIELIQANTTVAVSSLAHACQVIQHAVTGDIDGAAGGGSRAPQS